MATQRPASAALPSRIKTAGAPSSPYTKSLLPLGPVARTPGTDTWNIEAFAPEEPDKSTMRSTMRSRKARSPPPTWLVNSVAPPTTMDTSGPHMKAHIQSLAKLDKEELAEKLFHAKMALSNLEAKNKLAQVENRKLEATLAKSTAGGGMTGASNTGTACSTARAKSYSPARGKRAAVGDIVRNLKSKNKDLRVERDRALRMVAHLQRASRVAKLQELQAQVGVLKDEVANQMALQHGSNGVPTTMSRTASPFSPFANSRNGFRPASGPSGATSKRRLTEVLQELYNATKPLQQEAEKLQEACGSVSSADFSSEPQYRAAAKVHSFLLDHVVIMADHMSNMPCAQKLTVALRDMGLVETQRHSDDGHEVFGQPLNLMTPEVAQNGIKQVLQVVQGPTLAASLAVLAPALAAAVAHMESVTEKELEEDSWLKDGATKVAFMSRKFLECDALQQRNNVHGSESAGSSDPKSSQNKHCSAIESSASGQEALPLSPVGSSAQLPPVASIPTATPESSVQRQSSQLQRQESQLGSAQASLPPARSSSLSQRLQDRLAAATSIPAASQCVLDSSTVSGELKTQPVCSIEPHCQEFAAMNSYIPAELDNAPMRQAEDVSDAVHQGSTPEPDVNAAEGPGDAPEVEAVMPGSMKASGDHSVDGSALHNRQASEEHSHTAPVDAGMTENDAVAGDDKLIAALPSVETAQLGQLENEALQTAIEPGAMAEDVPHQQHPSADTAPAEEQVATGPEQVEGNTGSENDDEAVAISAPLQEQISVDVLPQTSLQAQTHEKLPLPAPSLTASELQAVDSAINCLLSIDEEDVYEADLSRQPTPTDNPVEQHCKDEDPQKSDSEQPGTGATVSSNPQTERHENLPTHESLGSQTAEQVLLEMVDDLALEFNSIEDA